MRRVAVAVVVNAAAAVEPSLHRGAARHMECGSSRWRTPQVWTAIVGLSDIETPDDLFFRGGLACPRTTRIVRRTGVEHDLYPFAYEHVRAETERWRGGRRA